MSTTHPTNETTEWDDLQRKFGNLPPLPKEVKEEEIYLQTIDKLENENALEKKSLNELKLLEEDCVDEEYLKIIQKYKNDRINETRKNRALEVFGDVYEISKDNFITHVNETSKYNPLQRLEEEENMNHDERNKDMKNKKNTKGTYVIVHMYSENVIACKIINNILNELAKKHKYVKFTKGVYNKIIENYPESKLPTILIYYNGVCVHQICNLLMYFNGGINSLNAKKFEQFLKKYNIFKIREQTCGKLSDDSEEDSEEERNRTSAKSKKQYTTFNMFSRRKHNNDHSDESDEDDQDSSDERQKNSKTYASSHFDKQTKYY